ncbi:MAG: AAA family ATPase [Nanoarchaeota archaeon]|nr:AAA family ATPase [Nanoarchaeota archaeon]
MPKKRKKVKPRIKLRTQKRAKAKPVKRISKTKTKPRISKEKAREDFLKKRITSGIPGFDKLIDGGFVNESVCLVVGGAGSGKTIFATQFLLEGLRQNEPGVFITFEEKKDRFYNEMKTLGWDLTELEKKKKFAFIEYTPEQVKKMLQEGGGEVEVVIEEIKAKRIVIDSITSFALLFESELEKREAALALFELLRKWKVTSILTLEHEPSMKKGSVRISTPLEFEVDGIVILYFLRTNNERIREFEILKMRGTEHSRGVFRFEIGKKGIKIKGKSKYIKIG